MTDDTHATQAEGDDAFAGAVGDALPGGYRARHVGPPDPPSAAQQAAAAAAYAQMQAGLGRPTPAAPEGPSGPCDPLNGGETPDVHPDAALAAERLADLQRLQAEYVNYKKRVDRDRAAQRDLAVGAVIESLLPVLDEIHLARQHGELESGPFAKIAEKLETVLSRHGVTRYGEPGETFDPTLHDAVMHRIAELAPGTTETTVIEVMRPGFRLGDRVIRAAMVSVADPQ
ncbi:MAG TPA: nucleotide exchange factor GrpE [Dermatophilaceae bacterium]|nr:nucleotide exchange factor GrpE [Dermatophilaceae bacterium]